MKYLQVLVVLCYGFILEASSYQPAKETQALIRGGNIVTDREFPYMAGISVYLYSYEDGRNIAGLFCGGTIISSTWILTAASCVKGDNNQTNLLQTVEIGRNSLSRDNYRQESGTTQRIAFAVVHRNYSGGEDYDIAMLKLKDAISFTPKIKNATLASNFRISYFGQMVGWGKSHKYNLNRTRPISRDLLKLTVSLYEKPQCKTFFGKEISTDLFCAISPALTTACELDAGGPMVSEGEVIGVLSRRSGDNCTVIPSVYVKIYPLISWIDDVRNNETYGKDDVLRNSGPYKVYVQ